MLYDLTELRSYSRGDKEFEVDLIQTFLDQTPELLSSMEYHLYKENIVELGRVAHKFKSSVGFFGMVGIKNTLQNIESACMNNAQKSDIAAHCAELKEQLMVVIPQIEEEKKHYLE